MTGRTDTEEELFQIRLDMMGLLKEKVSNWIRTDSQI